MGFLHFTIIDFFDILLVAYLFYQLYLVIRGTVALKIFILILLLYLVWLIVQALNMKLLSTILGDIIGLGLISILIVFQQEVKRFLLMFGNKYRDLSSGLENFLARLSGVENRYFPVEPIIDALEYFAKHRVGALLVIARQNDLAFVAETGVKLDALVSAELLKKIKKKNSPLHDGAVVIKDERILAAGCILPLSERADLPQFLGLRHRAAIGITENTDAFVIVVSEERGEISYAEYGNIFINVDINTLKDEIIKRFEVTRERIEEKKKKLRKKQARLNEQLEFKSEYF